MMNVYFKKYGNVSFFLTCMIVLRHSLNYKQYNFHQDSMILYIEKFFYCFTGFSVVLFALLAGFNFYKDLSPERVGDKMKKRVHTLLIPYVIAVTLNWSLYALIPHLPFLRDHLTGSLYDMSWKSYVLTLVTGGGTPLWYLRNLILMVGISPLIYKLIERKYIASMVVGVLLLVWEIYPMDEFSILYFAATYVAGAVMANHFSGIMLIDLDRRRKRFFGILFLSLILLDSIINFSDIERVRLPYTIAVAMIFWMIFPNAHNRRQGLYLYSFGIYMYHYFILECIKKVIFIIFGNKEITALFSFFFSPILTIVMLVLFFEQLGRSAPEAYRVILGGRGIRSQQEKL